LTQANPSSAAVQGIKAKLEMMPIDQLQQVAQTSYSEEVRTMALEVLQEKKIRAQAEQQAQASIAQDQRPMPTPVSERVGLPAAPAGAMDTLSAASGGIVAFAGDGPSLVKDLPDMSAEEYANYIRDVMGSDISADRKKRIAPMLGNALSQLTKKENPGAFETSQNKGLGASKTDTSSNQVSLEEDEAARLQQEFMARQKYENFAKKQREAAGIGAPKAGLADYYAKEQADLPSARKQKAGYNLLDFGVNLASQTGPLGFAAAKAGKAALPGMISREEDLRGREKDTAKGLAEVAEGQRLMKQGDITAGNAMYEKGQERLNKLEVAQSRKATDMVTYAQTYLAEKVATGDTRDPNVIFREGMDIKKRLDAEAQFARTGVAQQQVNVTGTNLSRDDANKEVSTFGTPGNERVKARIKAREAQPDYKNLSPAEKKAIKAQIKEQVRDEIMTKNQSGGSGGGNKGKAGTADNPIVIK
jgi:hypothetical protein